MSVIRKFKVEKVDGIAQSAEAEVKIGPLNGTFSAKVVDGQIEVYVNDEYINSTSMAYAEEARVNDLYEAIATEINETIEDMPIHTCPVPETYARYRNECMDAIFEHNISRSEYESEKNLVFPDINTVVDDILTEIKKGDNKNPYGERQSSYYSILSVDDNDLMVQVTEETDGLDKAEYFYSIHTIDDINEAYCVLRSCQLNKEALLSAIEEIRNSCMETARKER